MSLCCLSHINGVGPELMTTTDITLPALGGRYNVKSQQELLIANWLILNGIEHKYEAVFKKVDYKYTPDF